MSYSGLAQLAGAILVLAAFVLTQNGMGHPDAIYVSVLNAVGASILAYLALVDSQWGFVALEGIWSLLAAHKLTMKLLRRCHVPRNAIGGESSLDLPAPRERTATRQ